MEINLYTFSKRRNSTAIPSGEGYAVSVALKAPTSEREPVFQLAYEGELSHNYLKWGSRWYWVTGARHIHQGLLEISAQLDELATLRAEIFATDAFVLYDTTPNAEISDGRLSMETEPVEDAEYGFFEYLGFAGADPPVVVTVTGEDAIGSYYIPESDARGLLANVRSWAANSVPDAPSGTPTVIEAIEAAIHTYSQASRNIISAGDAAQNIRSAVMLPLPASAFSGTSRRVMLGLYQTGVTGLLLSGTTMRDHATVAIPWQANDWRRNAPYTSIRLYIPWVGMVSYPPSSLIGCASLRIEAAIDVRTGEAIFTVFAPRDGESHVIGRYSTSIGAAYPIGSSNVPPLNALTAIGSAAAGAAALMSGGLTAVAGGAAAIVGVANNVAPLETTAGGVGSAAAFALSPTVACYVCYHDTVVDPASVSAVIGTPAMAVKRLGTLSGFVQTRCASVSAAAMQQDIDAVNAALDGGVYLE